MQFSRGNWRQHLGFSSLVGEYWICHWLSTTIFQIKWLWCYLERKFWNLKLFTTEFFCSYCLVFTSFCECRIKQECIPVGCVPSTAVAISRGVCSGGVCSWGGGWYPSMHWGRPPPPVNRMTDRCKNITFTTSLRTVITNQLNRPHISSCKY